MAFDADLSSYDEEEPTKTLIVTNVDSGVFLDELTKSEFESEFLAFDKTAAFYYIRWVFLIPVNDECEREEDARQMKAKIKCNRRIERMHGNSVQILNL